MATQSFKKRHWKLNREWQREKDCVCVCVCVCTCVFLLNSSEVGEGCERPHCWCQGQSASKGWFRLGEASRSLSLSLSTHTHTLFRSAPWRPQKTSWFTIPPHSQRTIFGIDVQTQERGQGALRNMVQCVWEWKVKRVIPYSPDLCFTQTHHSWMMCWLRERLGTILLFHSH